MYEWSENNYVCQRHPAIPLRKDMFCEKCSSGIGNYLSGWKGKALNGARIQRGYGSLAGALRSEITTRRRMMA